jgi:hypothetical protein
MPLVEMEGADVLIAQGAEHPDAANPQNRFLRNPVMRFALCFIIEANRMNPVRQGQEIIRFSLFYILRGDEVAIPGVDMDLINFRLSEGALSSLLIDPNCF